MRENLTGILIILFIQILTGPLLSQEYPAPVFSHDRGFYSASFVLNISIGFEGAVLKYTTDCSDPVTSENAASTDSGSVIILVDPADSLSRPPTPAFIVRAVAIFPDGTIGPVATQTYIFSESVKVQGDVSQDSDWPAVFINPSKPKDYSKQWIDYEMAQDVVQAGDYNVLVDTALRAIPSISLVTDLVHLFGPYGIYTNAVQRGKEWERPVSVELIDPVNLSEFQINAGFRIRGGWSRRNDNPKHAFRLFFRTEYGASKLNHPMFENEGASVFDKLDLRTSMNYSWSFQGWKYNSNIMNRDVFSRDTQAEMEQPYTRSRYYHLYLNGMYWGLFQSQERSEARYAETYFGGDKEDYDVIKVIGWGLPNDHTNKATDGNMDAYRRLWDAAMKGFSNDTDYYKIRGLNTDGSLNSNYEKLLDAENLIDYMLINYYTGNDDGPVSPGETKVNNYYAVYNRVKPDGFKFFCHDSEHTLDMEILNRNMTFDTKVGTSFSVFNPRWLHQRLMVHPDYRQLFEDKIYKHFFNNGALTPERNINRFMKRADEINLAIIAESARWGDAKLNFSRTRDDDWSPVIQSLIEDYFPYRTDIVLNQFRARGWYSDMVPPDYYYSDSIFQSELLNASGNVKLNIVGKGASFYYTVNGADPRGPGGLISDDAIGGSDEIPLNINNTSLLQVRSWSQEGWSPLNELIVSLSDEFKNLIISEFHYYPLAGILDNTIIEGKKYEFIELYNSGKDTISLCGLSFSAGIYYDFSCGDFLPPDSYITLASDSKSFYSRYGFKPFDSFRGNLSNSGEEIILTNISGDTVTYINYRNTSPWPESIDLLGYSLVYKYDQAGANQNDPLNWSISSELHGNPATTVQTYIHNDGILDLEMQLYPNPVQNEFRVYLRSKASSGVKISLLDLSGQHTLTLYSGKMLNEIFIKEFDRNDLQLSPGFYIISVQNEYGIISKRIVIL